jgi:anti-sigma regulatory factor (Ser/Thr protein kinase)
MTATAALHHSPESVPGPYRHAAVFYAGREDFVAKTAGFIRAGVAAGEPALVVVDAVKIDLLRRELRGCDSGVEFADMADVGANPARIIPAWQAFVEAHDGRAIRGIGEPIFPDRSHDELAECQHHERLLNPALEGSSLQLICPYDTEALPREVIDEARRSHPLVHDGRTPRPSDGYDEVVASAGLFSQPLPDLGAPAELLPFDQAALPRLRALVRLHAEAAGIDPARTGDLVLAAGEIATNSIRHAGGRGTMRIWRDAARLICEIRDSGRIDDPLIDRRRPTTGQVGGWGLWIANQACDLVQLRSLSTGTVARMHMQLA